MPKCNSQVLARSVPAKTEELGKILDLALDDSRRRVGAPGAAAAIVQSGELLWQGVSGEAIIDAPVKVTAETLFIIASVTKTYVATMVLRLYEEGLLDLDDTIDYYLKQDVPDSDRVTIRHLLSMTSGYADIEESVEFSEWSADQNHIWNQSQLFDLIEPVFFEPGTEFEYSNVNYLLLGAILAEAAQESVADLFEKLILVPVGLKRTFFDRTPSVAAQIAHGYEESADGPSDYFRDEVLGNVPADVWGTIWTDGGIAASAPDVAIFFDALLSGRVLTPGTLSQMLNSGPEGSYGLGIYPFSDESGTWQGHSGEYGGFTAEAWHHTESELTLVVLTNYSAESETAEVIWEELAAAFFDQMHRDS